MGSRDVMGGMSFSEASEIVLMKPCFALLGEFSKSKTDPSLVSLDSYLTMRSLPVTFPAYPPTYHDTIHHEMQHVRPSPDLR